MKSPNSADCAIRDLWFTHSCALHTILQFYYIYLMINTSHFPQKLFETCISLSSQFFSFYLLLSYWTLLFFFHMEKLRLFSLILSAFSLHTIYSSLLLSLPYCYSFRWRRVFPAFSNQFCFHYFPHSLFWELFFIISMISLCVFHLFLSIDSF